MFKIAINYRRKREVPNMGRDKPRDLRKGRFKLVYLWCIVVGGNVSVVRFPEPSTTYATFD